MIRRRFEAGLRLLTQVYQPLVDQWSVYNNSGDQPVLLDWSDAMTNPNKVNEHLPAYRALPVGDNANLQGALAAMQRAAERARRVAQETGTDLIVVRAGQVVRIPAHAIAPA